MRNREQSETVESELVNAQRLAKSLVGEAWNLGGTPMAINVNYEGAEWEVIVRVRSVE